jgi:zinc/manganese transport system substrate-binding protein
MSRHLNFLIVALVAIILAGCGESSSSQSSSQESTSENRLSVVATTAQIGALVEEVAGDLVDLHILMGSGVDPHDFELTPAHLRALHDADLVLRNGIGLDDFLDPGIASAGGSATVVTVTGGIDLITGGHHHEEDEHEDDDHEHDHEHGEFDPHVWHDPANVKIMTDNIVAAISAEDSSLSDSVSANGEAYKDVLDETDRKIRDLIDAIPEERRVLVTTHDAFGYFIHAYGLEFIGAVIPSTTTGSEPSAKDIAALSELIREHQVPAIFIEATLDSSVATQLANDTGVKIVQGLHSDSLGEPGSGAETIHGMLLANATLISEALR